MASTKSFLKLVCIVVQYMYLIVLYISILPLFFSCPFILYLHRYCTVLYTSTNKSKKFHNSISNQLSAYKCLGLKELYAQLKRRLFIFFLLSLSFMLVCFKSGLNRETCSVVKAKKLLLKLFLRLLCAQLTRPKKKKKKEAALFSKINICPAFASLFFFFFFSFFFTGKKGYKREKIKLG